MKIEFVDKNGRIVIITVHGVDGDLVLELLSKLPDSEFICHPHQV